MPPKVTSQFGEHSCKGKVVWPQGTGKRGEEEGRMMMGILSPCSLPAESSWAGWFLLPKPQLLSGSPSTYHPLSALGLSSLFAS